MRRKEHSIVSWSKNVNKQTFTSVTKTSRETIISEQNMQFDNPMLKFLMENREYLSSFVIKGNIIYYFVVYTRKHR